MQLGFQKYFRKLFKQKEKEERARKTKKQRLKKTFRAAKFFEGKGCSGKKDSKDGHSEKRKKQAFGDMAFARKGSQNLLNSSRMAILGVVKTRSPPPPRQRKG